jgi:hypothetical protein
VEPARYEIIVRGRLGGVLTRAFDELEVKAAGTDETSMRGWFEDQSALQGVLSHLGALGIELSSVRRIDRN